jgi:chromosome segregation ATPase
VGFRLPSLLAAPRLTPIHDQDGVAPVQKPVAKNVQLLQERARKLAIDAEQKAIEAEQAVQHTQELQSTLHHLNLEHDRACDQLSHADAQFAQFQSSIAQIEQALLSEWGKLNGHNELVQWPDYQALNNYRSAIADFPRVRKSIVTKVEATKQALSKFERDL